MTDEHEFEPPEPAKTGPEIPSGDSAGTAPQTEPEESSKAEPGAEPEVRGAAESEPGAGCPILRSNEFGPRCGRILHLAPIGVDERPVCLMHSNDEGKRTGPLFEEFWRTFERILEEAGEGDAHFEGFVFPAVNLGGRTYKAICRFDGATFMLKATFRDATFARNAFFDKVTFIKHAVFSNATFLQFAGFNSANFTEGADFWKATFTWFANFIAATFAHSTLFVEANFKQSAEFRASTFKGSATFEKATVTQKADFAGATFAQNAFFIEATFTQHADFHLSTFVQNADFTAATFTQYADFRGATFTQNADFAKTIFCFAADWRSCRFLDRARFQNTRFAPEIASAPSAVFSLARFAKPNEIIFDQVDLSHVLFHNCDASDVWFTSSVRWSQRRAGRGLAVFEEEIVLDPKLLELIKNYGPIDHGAVEQIYHQLKKNYDARLDYRKANDFHFGEMEMRRLEVRTYPKLLKPWGWLRPWLGPEALYRWASNYGNGYVKPGLWLIAVIFAATLIYPWPGLKRVAAADPSDQSGCKACETYCNSWIPHKKPSDNLWTEAKLIGKGGILAVDTATFQKSPEYTPAYPWGRVVAILETLLTSTLFALFLLAIRRQFRR